MFCLFEYMGTCGLHTDSTNYMRVSWFQVFASMMLQALRCAVLFLHGTSFYVDAHGRATDPLHINALIEVLLSFLRDPTLPKYSCHQVASYNNPVGI